MRDVEELAELGPPTWARWVRVRGAVKESRASSTSRSTVGGATIRPGDVVVLDADGVAVVAAERVDEVLAAAREREEKERVKGEKLAGGALSYDLDGLRAKVEGAAALSEIAHLGPVELLTPEPDESLRFFVEVLGMEVEGREGQSVYLRGWGDYQRYSLKLTESDTSGMACSGSGRGARRRSSGASPRSRRPGSAALDRRATAVAGRPTASPAPTGTCSSSTTRSSATSRPSTCGRR